MDSAVALTLFYAVGYYPHCAVIAELLYSKLRTLRGKSISVEFFGDLLVEELHKQGEELGVPYEILVGEDGTSSENLRLNIAAEILPNCRRIIREKNI